MMMDELAVRSASAWNRKIAKCRRLQESVIRYEHPLPVPTREDVAQPSVGYDMGYDLWVIGELWILRITKRKKRHRE